MVPLLLACATPEKPATDAEDSAADSAALPASAIRVEPASLAFGPLETGQSESRNLTFTNDGDDEVDVTEIAVRATCAAGLGCFTVDTADALGTYAPGDRQDATVTWVASGYGDAGTLFVVLHGGAEVPVDLTSVWSGPPFAVCSAGSGVPTVGTPVQFVGGDSFSPDGHATTTYTWTLLSSPDGSTATPICSGSDCELTPDLAGTYEAQLVVTDDRGWESDPCVTHVDVYACDPARLCVILTWAHTGDDMDLHLLAPGGTLRSNSDCYYGNCVGRGLDWGTRGLGDDDPELDGDDIPGTGPEMTHIKAPADGSYTVYVNDYPGSSYADSDDTTVAILLDGVLVWEDTRAITGENADVPFATIDFPDGVVTPL